MDINFLDFLGVLLPVALSPGASFTLVMSSALAGGRNGLFRTLAGTALGIYTHAILIGLGITAVIVSSPSVYDVLKIIGTVYLLWLGIMLIRSGLNAERNPSGNSAAPVTLGEAWLANILNPKAIIFYITVVSQFSGQHGGVGNYLALASVHVAVMSLWLIAISRILVFSVNKANPVKLKKYVNIIGGMLLILFSLRSLT